MRIKFNDHAFTVRRNSENLFSLTDIEKGWRASGGKGKSLTHWKRSPTYLELEALREIRVIVKRPGSDGKHTLTNENAGTWGDKDAVIEYSSYCSIPFRSAVRRSFIASTEGEAVQAIDIAASALISDELIEKEKRLRLAMNELIAAQHPGNHHAFSNFIGLSH